MENFRSNERDSGESVEREEKDKSTIRKTLNERFDFRKLMSSERISRKYLSKFEIMIFKSHNLLYVKIRLKTIIKNFSPLIYSVIKLKRFQLNIMMRLDVI